MTHRVDGQAEAVVSGQRSTRAADVEVGASQAVREQWRRTRSGSLVEVIEEKPSGQREVAGECPICYDDFGGEDDVVWCKVRHCIVALTRSYARARVTQGCPYRVLITCLLMAMPLTQNTIDSQACGNNIHRNCFANWAKAKRDSYAAVTCVYCRAVWDADGGKDQTGYGGDAIVNLRQYSEAHANADVSLETLYGESAVWIRNAGRNRARAAALYDVSRGAL